MYADFYQLDGLPFQFQPDIRYLYTGAGHDNTLAKLQYFKQHHDGGVLCLSGESGTGKSLALRAADIPTIKATPKISTELLQLVCHALALNISSTRLESLIELERATGSIIAIDEAQLLDEDLSEQLRLLVDAVGMRLVLCGSEFNISDSMRHRVVMDWELKPLTSKQTGDYINHRLQVAGTTEPLFSTDAMAVIHKRTKGIPREINSLCDALLFFGYSEQQQQINADFINQIPRTDLPRGKPETIKHEIKQQTQEQDTPTDSDTGTPDSAEAGRT